MYCSAHPKMLCNTCWYAAKRNSNAAEIWYAALHSKMTLASSIYYLKLPYLGFTTWKTIQNPHSIVKVCEEAAYSKTEPIEIIYMDESLKSFLCISAKKKENSCTMLQPCSLFCGSFTYCPATCQLTGVLVIASLCQRQAFMLSVSHLALVLQLILLNILFFGHRRALVGNSHSHSDVSVKWLNYLKTRLDKYPLLQPSSRCSRISYEFLNN